MPENNLQKGFFLRSKRKLKEMVGPLMGEDGKMAASREEAELLNSFFAAVFNFFKNSPICQKQHGGRQKRNSG